MARTKKRGRPKKKTHKVAPELTGFILFFTSLLALGSFGFVGRFITNVFRLFVGETYAFMAIILLAPKKTAPIIPPPTDPPILLLVT